MSRVARASILACGVAAALVAVASCADNNNTIVSQLNLDRPVDLAFACYGDLRITNGGSATISQPIERTAQPLASCDGYSAYPSATVPVPTPPGQDDLTGSGGQQITHPLYYAFILQSVDGTVAIANFPSEPNTSFAGSDVIVQDADPLTPGKNAFTIGELPIAIKTDASGCYEVTANAGSCDLSELDISTALDADPAVRVDRQPVTTSTGAPLRSKPAAMAAQPQTAPVGQECPATATGLMYVAYPSCHLVAGIDVSTGMVVTGIQYDATGVPSLINGDVTCPDECGGGAVTITPGVRPSTVDLQLDPRVGSERLVIGAENSSAITIVELGSDSMPTSLSQVALSDPTGTLGLTTVALTPQIGMGGDAPDPAAGVDDSGSQFQFVYAVATDQTVRVADVLNVRKECDTQVDPRYLHDVTNVSLLSCLPVGDPATPPRRTGARGPGIVLTNGAVPTSVAIIKGDTYTSPADNRPVGPGTLLGYFAVITAASGGTFVVNIDDDLQPDTVNQAAPIGTEIPLDIAHQLRDSLPGRNALAVAAGTTTPICDTDGDDPADTAGNNGGPRLTAPLEGGSAAPVRVIPTGFIDASKVNNLPSLHTVMCVGTDEPTGKPVSELQFAAPVAQREYSYPDWEGLPYDEAWTLTWEGSLSNDSVSTAVNGPPVREGQMVVDGTGTHLTDQTAPFCSAGVEPYDIVQLRGCDPSLGDEDCPSGYICFVHPDSQVVGLGACMLTNEASRLADACREFLISDRTYTAGPDPTTGKLTLLPRRHELSDSPVDGCTDDAQCTTLATLLTQLNDPSNPVDDKTPADKHSWSCSADPYRPAGINRCQETCQTDTDCDAGTVCQTGFCMEGIEPPQSCVNAPQRYDLRASDAFVITGAPTQTTVSTTTSTVNQIDSAVGYVHPIIADAAGNCIVDPTAPPTKIGRIPLVAPPCTGDGITDLSPNPCSEQVDQFELEPQFGPNCATLGTQAGHRTTTGIRFSNAGMTFHLVDGTYPGDKTCTGDRMGTLGNIPLEFMGYQITFRQTGGWAPLTLLTGVTSLPALPIKAVRGPGQSIWVIDEGDYLSTDYTTASTKGQVYRIESIDLGITSTLQ